MRAWYKIALVGLVVAVEACRSPRSGTGSPQPPAGTTLGGNGRRS